MRIILLILTTILIGGCEEIPNIDGVHYIISKDCNGSKGFWTPGNICYDGSNVVKKHENCHQIAFQDGYSLEENAIICGDKQ